MWPARDESIEVDVNDRAGPNVVENRVDCRCDVCRRKKLRCFIEPEERTCTLCRVQGIECTFVEQPLKRKRDSGQQARGSTKSPPLETGTGDALHPDNPAVSDIK
jgi:hypothetical protein